MKPLRYIAPVMSIGLLTVLAALPWGLPSQDRFFLPLLPVIAIHYWALRRPDALPEWAVFLAGLLLDIFTHGPLGYWPVVYLATYILGAAAVEQGRKSRIVRLAAFFVSLTRVTVLSWVLASAYYLELSDWHPYGRGALLAAASAFLIVPIISLFDMPAAERDAGSLTRDR